MKPELFDRAAQLGDRRGHVLHRQQRDPFEARVLLVYVW